MGGWDGWSDQIGPAYVNWSWRLSSTAIGGVGSLVSNLFEGSRSKFLSILYSLGHCSIVPWSGYQGKMVAGASASEVR